MRFDEHPFVFGKAGARCLGIVTRPRGRCLQGLLVVVGGPQYRAGSHRQFTLLCRALAEAGIVTMRFDYTGMGDSEGRATGFEECQPAVRAAIDAFWAQVPELRKVAIWGLCDGASAAALYAHSDSRVNGLVLLNPWVRTASGLAKTQLKHYYWARIVERSFWRKVARGEFRLAESVRSLVGNFREAKGRSPESEVRDSAIGLKPASSAVSLPDRMADGLGRFNGKILLILSGKDLTALEFSELESSSPRWQYLLSPDRTVRVRLPEADHTFSRHEWSEQVEKSTSDWVRSL